MCWCAPTTHRWSLISTTKDVCARATCTGWRTRCLCGPKGDSAHWEQYISLGILLRQEPRPGEWMLHPDAVKKIGECLARLRRTSSLLRSSRSHSLKLMPAASRVLLYQLVIKSPSLWRLAYHLDWLHMIFRAAHAGDVPQSVLPDAASRSFEEPGLLT